MTAQVIYSLWTAIDDQRLKEAYRSWIMIEENVKWQRNRNGEKLTKPWPHFRYVQKMRMHFISACLMAAMYRTRRIVSIIIYDVCVFLFWAYTRVCTRIRALTSVHVLFYILCFGCVSLFGRFLDLWHTQIRRGRNAFVFTINRNGMSNVLRSFFIAARYEQ